MKTKVIYLCLTLFIGAYSSCTPTAVNEKPSTYKAPPTYGSGGEHSNEPDNEKD